jgi:6-phosphogluconolactonase
MIDAEKHFADREALAAALAADVAAALVRSIAARGTATLAVSGGTTPALFLAALSEAGIAWDRVTVTLVDERQVPETSARSNARLVRAHLLQNKAAAARFVPLFDNPDAARLDRLDVVVLGMGSDGHTASYFPGGDRLAEALDPQGKVRLIAMTAPAAGEPRLTFTLPLLLGASALMLHIEGQEKRDVLDKALAEGPAGDMPIRAVLRGASPVTVYWCR